MEKFYNIKQYIKGNDVDSYNTQPNEMYNKENYKGFDEKVSNDYWNAAASLFIHQSLLISDDDVLGDQSKPPNLKEINKKIVEFNEGSSLRDESHQYCKQYLVLCDMFQKKNQPLSIDQVLLWQKSIFSGAESFVGFRKSWASSSRSQMIFIEPKEIRTKLSNLIKEYNGYLRDHKTIGKTPIFSITAWFLHNFTLIHPFEDGNSRMALLLANYILFSFDFPCPVPFFNTRSQYFSKLSQCDTLEKENKDNLTNLIIQNCSRVINNYKYLHSI